MTGLIIGTALCSLAVLLGGYELVALWTHLPTISRVIQGYRDGSGHTVVTVLTDAIVAGLALFGAWVNKHFKNDKRSTL